MKLNGLPNKSAVRLVDLRLNINEMIDNSSYSQRELAIMANVCQRRSRQSVFRMDSSSV